MKNRFLVAGLVAIGVAACGDDVQVVEPPPLPPPPLAVTMSPASQTIGVGGTVVFAVSVSGGAAGEASWTCASSDPSKATVSNTSAGCQATAVAAGGVSITAAVTKGGQTVNAGAGLTILEDMAEPAFLALALIKDNSDEDDEVLSGRVSVTLNVERGDQMLMQLSLLVDGVVAATLPFGGASAVAAPEDEPAAQAAHAFILSFNSAGYNVVTGEPTYMNGEHTISAALMVAGSDEPIGSGVHTVEFGNDDRVHVMVSGLGDGAMNPETGQIWYGGPSAMIEITAVPVLYSGGSAASVAIREFCGASAATDAEAPFVFTPKCKSTSGEAGETPRFTIAAADVETARTGDDIFPLYMDFAGPPAPTFSPNPNGREDGWVNLAVDFLGEQKSSNKNGWLKYNEDDAGVGGYNPRLRYAEKGLDEALAAPILTLANLPGESKLNAYCAVVSAVDLLGNESDLPDEEDDGGTCEIAGMASVEEDLTASPQVDAVEATGYMALLEAANADMPADDAAENLANAGLMVGVDITPPAVEFTGATPKDGATALGAGWVLHVTDGGSGLATEPIDASVEVRDGDGTEDVDEAGETPEAGEFVLTVNTPNTRFTTAINTPAEAAAGYYTFAATATDKAGNETASGSRMALHDLTLPTPIRLFVAPGADDSTYDKTLLANDNLSIAGYQVNLPVPGTYTDLDSPEIMLGAETVDAYNASSLTDDLLVRGPVEFPYLALQNGMAGQPEHIAAIKAYVSDQVGTPAGQSATEGIVEPDGDDIPQVTGFRVGGGGFTVTATDGDDNTTVEDGDNMVEITATADLPDESTDFPFSRVDFYAEVTVTVAGDDYSELRLIATVDGNSATVKTLGAAADNDERREWTYATEVDADAYYAAVDGDGEFMGNVAAFGVSTEEDGSVAVVVVSADLTLEERE